MIRWRRSPAGSSRDGAPLARYALRDPNAGYNYVIPKAQTAFVAVLVIDARRAGRSWHRPVGARVGGASRVHGHRVARPARRRPLPVALSDRSRCSSRVSRCARACPGAAAGRAGRYVARVRRGARHDVHEGADHMTTWAHDAVLGDPRAATGLRRGWAEPATAPTRPSRSRTGRRVSDPWWPRGRGRVGEVRRAARLPRSSSRRWCSTSPPSATIRRGATSPRATGRGLGLGELPTASRLTGTPSCRAPARSSRRTACAARVGWSPLYPWLIAGLGHLGLSLPYAGHGARPGSSPTSTLQALWVLIGPEWSFSKLCCLAPSRRASPAWSMTTPSSRSRSSRSSRWCA